MKTKTFLLLLFLTTSNLFAQGNHKSPDDVVYIPDPNFLFRLLHHTGFSGVQIDTNYNNQIEVSEAEALSEMRVGDPFANNYKIVDMTGIEAFVNLTKLECYNNEIENLDLSQNTLLEYLDCSTNNIHSLNVTQCTALVDLICWGNQLSSLDVSNNSNLVYLRCGTNNISNIDISNNLLLEKIYCGENLLTSLNTSKNNQLKELNVSDNNVSNLDLTLNTQLVHLGCSNNTLSFLDVRNGNNQNFHVFIAENNNLLNCIFVDNASYSTENWLNQTLYFGFDPNSHFIETQEQCDALSIDEVNQVNTLMVIPNPVNNSFIIDTDFDYKGISIYNNIGKLIAKYNKQKRYFLTELTAGFYYIQIESPEGLLTKKIIKR